MLRVDSGNMCGKLIFLVHLIYPIIDTYRKSVKRDSIAVNMSFSAKNQRLNPIELWCTNTLSQIYPPMTTVTLYQLLSLSKSACTHRLLSKLSRISPHQTTLHHIDNLLNTKISPFFDARSRELLSSTDSISRGLVCRIIWIYPDLRPALLREADHRLIRKKRPVDIVQRVVSRKNRRKYGHSLGKF